MIEGPRRTPLRQAVAAQTSMELRLLVRSSESVLVMLGIPLGILVFFSSVDVLPTGDDPVAFLVPGVLAISVMSTGLVALAIQTAFERKYGVLKRLGGSPLPRSAFLLAKGLAISTLLVGQTALVLAVAAIGLDWEPSGSALAVVIVMVLGAFAFSSLGLLMAGTLRAEATLGLSNAVFLVLLVSSGLMFESDTLPEALRAGGRVMPSGALGEAARSALESGSFPVGPAVELLVWGVIATALAARFFRWDG